MTKTKGFVLAALLMASTSTMAISQTTVPDPTTGGGATSVPTPGASGGASTDSTTGTTTGTSATTDTTADTTGMADDAEHRQLITNLSMAASGEQDWAADFEVLSDDSEVKIVTLSDLKSADDAQSPLLDQAISDLEDSKDDLHAAIGSHESLTSALEEKDYSADDVVAAYVQPGDGQEVTLIVDAEGGSAD